jgi:MFS family permease
MTIPSSADKSARSPLAEPVFRALWIATVASNVGTWMQDAGSGWLMTSLTSAPLMVALIQAATTLPIFLFALPGGALADIVDRRRLLIASQIMAIGGAAGLGLLTWLGLTTPWILLCASATMGCAAAMSGPAFQAIVPELVPAASLRQAINLNSLGVNISRAIGPALGGMTIAFLGPAAVFGANALLTATVAVVLFRWQRSAAVQSLPSEHFLGAIRSGLRYARGAPALQAVLVRTFSFFLFSSALLALLPLIGRRSLALDAQHYGLLLGSMGVGAVFAAVALKPVLSRVPTERLFVGASVVLAFAMVALAHAHGLVIAMVCMAVAGGAWITNLATLNGAAQRATPTWVKARSLAIYLVFFQGAMALGAVTWGSLATRFGVAVAITCAAVGLVATLPLGVRYRLPEGDDLEPAMDWPAPPTAGASAGDRGPVMIVVEYRIRLEQMTEFASAMRKLESLRRRDGAYQWALFEDGARPGLMVETFLLSSWLEHLRQHERRTHADVPLQDVVREFHVGDSPPAVRHLLAPGSSA